MSETRWNNFELLSFSDGATRLNVGISSPSDNEATSRCLFQISLSNDAVRHNLNMNYQECLEVDAIFSKLRNKDFLSKLFDIVRTKGTQEVIRNIKSKVLRISFFISRDGQKAAKIAIYSNPNDILEIVVPLSVVLAICEISRSYTQTYIDIVLRAHAIRRLDELISISKGSSQELSLIKLNLNNLANSESGVKTTVETTSPVEEPESEDNVSDLLADFQMFEASTDVKIEVPDHVTGGTDKKK